MNWLLLLFTFVSQWNKPYLVSAEDSSPVHHGCNSFGVCLPGAEDIAVAPRSVIASNTCGNPPGEYCVKGPTGSCFRCDSSSTINSHPVDFMIDRSQGRSMNLTTWWQSQTWWEWFQSNKIDPLKVNVTLTFNKTYLITGQVRVTFKSQKPSMMIMEKSADFGHTWIPLQYFAKQCSDFNMNSSLSNCSLDGVLCTEKYIDENPGPLYFSFLDCYTQTNFWEMETQSLFIATNLRFRLEYPGTDGQQSKKTEDTLNRYFYAISDIQVFGRCHCNGHAPNCHFKTKLNEQFINTPWCMCKHNTEGVDCEKCKPLFNNKTWMPATSTKKPNLCEKCECNEHASSCTFNSSLGHGVCDECRNNTTGYFCEQCKDKFYRNLSKHLNDSNVCLDCDCILTGVTNNGSCSQDIATIGQCMCNDNVTGRRCDRCNDMYYGYMLPPVGTCLECLCSKYGTINGSLNCHNETGQCTCKSNAHLRTCSECKVGFFKFPNSTEEDCSECNCDSGGSTEEVCEKIQGKCLCRYGVQGETCSNVTDNRFFPDYGYFLFEAEYQSGNFSTLSDLNGYNRYFTGRGYARITRNQYIDFAVSVDINANYSLVLRYSDNTFGNVSIQLRGEASSNCSAVNQTVSINNLLPHGRALSWSSRETFMLCSNNTYTIRVFSRDTGKNLSIDIDSLILFPQLTKLHAYKNNSNLVDTCLRNYTTIQGSCASALNCRSVTFSTMVELFNGSVACKCSEIGAENQTTCAAYGGQCHCKPGVMGRTCDRCQPGYYNFSVDGCTPCDCDNNGSKNYVCDPNSGQCDCKSAVVERICGRCQVNFFGLRSGNGCEPCNCNTTGSKNATCDDVTGKCFCHPGVEDEQIDKCDSCKSYFFNFTETGCRPCNCSKAGSRSLQCHSSGECPCKMNTHGKKCEQCVNQTFALEESNPSGCTPCFCFNRTRQCSSAQGFVLTSIVYSNSTFLSDGSLLLPYRFSGNQLYSYGRLFEMKMFGARNFSGDVDLHLKSSRHRASFRLANRHCPTSQVGVYCALIHEKQTTERLKAYEMQSLLVDLGEVFLNITHQMVNDSLNTVVNVSLGSATSGNWRVNEKANHVEYCRCPKSYETLSCEKCNSGFTRDIANTSGFVGCSPCSCNNRSTICNPETRVCSNCRLSVGDFCEKCKNGVDNATQCTTCLPEFWSSDIYKHGCKACNCVLNNTVNENSSVCNITSGQCSCKTYVGGQQCERCDDNYHNTSHGCRECPECYGLIQGHIRTLRTDIEKLENIVEKLTDRFQSIERPKFSHRLNVAKSNVSRIFEKANFSANQDTADLNGTVKGLDDLSSRIKELSDRAQREQQHKLEADINNTTNWIETAYDLLKNAELLKPLVEQLTDMMEHFILPIEMHKEMLSRLNKIHQDISLNLSNHSKTWSREIDTVLSSAKMSRTILANSTKSLHVVRNNSQAVFNLARDTKILSTNFSKTAEDLSDTSKDILENVRELAQLTEVNRNLSGSLKIYNQSASTYSALEQNVSNSVQSTETQVNHARQYLNLSSNQLADAKTIQLKANDANESAQTTLRDARKTLTILRQFQNRSKNAMQEAKDSLDETTTADDSSRKSIEHTRNVSKSINDALNSTNDAVRLVKKAYSLSRQENQNITSIYNRTKFLEEKQMPSRCSHDLMKRYKENTTSRSGDLKRIFSSCPRHNATNASRLAGAALAESEKTKRETDDLHQTLLDVQDKVPKATDAVEGLRSSEMTKVQQSKIQSYNASFHSLRETLKQLRRAKDEKNAYIQDLKVRVRTLALEIKELKTLRDSLNSITPCGLA